MSSVARQLWKQPSFFFQLRLAHTGPVTRRRNRWSPTNRWNKKADEKSEWWIVDGEMHEIGDNVPPRERFVIPRDNLPNKRRKQMREQFMRRTRLVLKESEHEPWCKRYMELYQELRENWERLYWDEGYSKKIAQDHANYESPEDDEEDFSPYRSRSQSMPPIKDQGFGHSRQSDTWGKVGQIRDKFEHDRERRMREKVFFTFTHYNPNPSEPRIQDLTLEPPPCGHKAKAFAPMNVRSGSDFGNSASRIQPLDAQRFFPDSSTGW